MRATPAHFNQEGSLYVTGKHSHLTSLGGMTDVRQTSPAHMERAGVEVKPGPRSDRTQGHRSRPAQHSDLSPKGQSRPL